MLGEFDILEGLDYNLMVSNGTVDPSGMDEGVGDDYNPHNEDDNANKAIGARARLNLSDTWQVGLSLYF
jgi:hypothetical protein